MALSIFEEPPIRFLNVLIILFEKSPSGNALFGLDLARKGIYLLKKWNHNFLSYLSEFLPAGN